MCRRLCCQKKMQEEQDERLYVLRQEREERQKELAYKKVNKEIGELFRQS